MNFRFDHSAPVPAGHAAARKACISASTRNARSGGVRTGLALALAAVALSACVAMESKGPGSHAIGERLSVQLDSAWNHLNSSAVGPAQVWTMEGLSVDRLDLYSGIKPETVMHPHSAAGKLKTVKYRSGMRPDELVTLFEQIYTRDGSSFTLTKAEPSQFLEQSGVRFEFSVTRKRDNVRLSGLGYATTAEDELYALIYTAPRLTFFSRHAGRVDEIARAARLQPAKKAG
ncbi:MAG: hypothetical protein JNM98_21165 [Rhodocyclaceae bacterium]|nr:hypothetical protein [Rhodocyclaceae bacterium]